jgi:hypothetical protein
MGARVIALGRNTQTLEKLKKLGDRVETEQLTGDLLSEMARQWWGPKLGSAHCQNQARSRLIKPAHAQV